MESQPPDPYLRWEYVSMSRRHLAKLEIERLDEQDRPWQQPTTCGEEMRLVVHAIESREKETGYEWSQPPDVRSAPNTILLRPRGLLPGIAYRILGYYTQFTCTVRLFHTKTGLVNHSLLTVVDGCQIDHFVVTTNEEEEEESNLKMTRIGEQSLL